MRDIKTSQFQFKSAKFFIAPRLRISLHEAPERFHAMAKFSDLAVELQNEIWTLVLPHRGGVHWIEFEGQPLSAAIIHKTFERVRDIFDNKEPEDVGDIFRATTVHEAFGDYLREKRRRGDRRTPFFQSLYTIVPALWGSSRGNNWSDIHDSNAKKSLEDEIEYCRRCRRLSTYTQITTLLSTCRISRLIAQYCLYKMIPDGAWPIFRGMGPMYRPRHLNIWKRQYQDTRTAPDSFDKPQLLIPCIYASMDLTVFRMHDVSGYSTTTVKHACYQMNSENCQSSGVIDFFRRVGIEWNPFWATPEGREAFGAQYVRNAILLMNNVCQIRTQLYWLVDGIARPKWDQYPPAIPAAFSRVIETRRPSLLRGWDMGEEGRSRLLQHHDLRQEFEANGRRYYVVFVIARWSTELESYIEKSYLDPTLNWDGIFPGGENLWPASLHDPARFAFDHHEDLGAGSLCSYILSWEPI
jgi:hypothetical protein